jgi:DNA-binding CsgD family transcriptional regulator
VTTIDPVVAPSPAGLLLERDRQLDELGRILDQVRDGEGTTVLVVGEAGVGKSLLLRELLRSVNGLSVLRARGDELEQEFPFGVVRQLLEPVLRTAGDGVWDGPAELAREVFTPQGDGAGDDASFARQQGLYWLVVNLSEQLGPLLLAVDDAHRADEPSLRFLRFLGHRLDGLQVAQVLATRPAAEVEHRPALADMFEDVPLLAVDRLSIEATTTYLARAWPEAAEGLAPVCHALTAGNPLMLRALVAEARGNVTTPAQLQALGVRPIGQRVRRSLNGAPPGALRLAQAVSVLGDDTSVAEAVAFAGVDEPAAAVDALLRANVLEEDHGWLRFVHPLVRTSVYRLLSPVERAATHLRAATALHERGVTGEQVAAHLLHAGPTGHAWAARELEEAAERALELGAPDSAASLLARAIDEPAADAAQLARRLARLGDAASHAGLPDALSHYERALAIAPTRPIALQYAGALGMAGETARSFEVLSGLAGEPTPEQQAALHAAALFTDSPAARAFRDSMVGLEPTEPLLAGTVAYELAIRNVPAPELALRFCGAPLDLSTTGAWGYGIWALLLLERFSEARTELDRAVELGRRTGALVTYALALVLRAGLHLRSGALQAAEADALQSLELSQHPSWRFGNAASMQFLVEILLEQGRLEEAAEAAATIDAVPQIAVDALARQARARVLLAQRRPEEALAAARAAGERAAATLTDNAVLVPWRRTAALASGSLELAEEQLTLARAFGAPAAIGDALITRAFVSRSVEGLDEAAQVAHPVVRARALLALGRAERVGGAPAAAREPLREAMELASAAGARGLVDEALDELAAAGARPRRRGGHGAHLLTAAEARVARLAADGASNREIAQELFVTLKTVEMHLSSAYRKLDISSRAQLAARLD